ncbi:LOW QUALITY PROTEIN: reverse transcriptase [Phytophthora megakarya]|uniref:Reverse transcriptase n=1 Tax=Phytophthora megakarya TaxID=4795 RepID=A0A225WZ50_9STRA|nr:LOW QUALITY PROTEIN: reverse transcriptase [Phytophthora megakarya]
MSVVVGLRGEACASKSVGRLATYSFVKTEEREICARFSYKHQVFAEALLVLDLDDKFDMELSMPWLTRHDPIIDWEKRTVVRCGRRGATESDGPVSAADTHNGASNLLQRRWLASLSPRVVDRKKSVWSGTRHYQEILRREASR